MDGPLDPDGKILMVAIPVGSVGGHHHLIPADHLVDDGTIKQIGMIQGKKCKYLQIKIFKSLFSGFSRGQRPIWTDQPGGPNGWGDKPERSRGYGSHWDVSIIKFNILSSFYHNYLGRSKPSELSK